LHLQHNETCTALLQTFLIQGACVKNSLHVKIAATEHIRTFVENSFLRFHSVGNKEWPIIQHKPGNNWKQWPIRTQ